MKSKTLDDGKLKSVVDTLAEKINRAQDITFMQRWFNSQLSCNPAFEGLTSIVLHSVNVVRLKAGRRCLLEYCCITEKASRTETTFFIGKIHARHSGKSMFEFMKGMYYSHFGIESFDAILVPEPIGYIAECNIWLQRKVRGCSATSLLFSDDSNNPDTKIALGRRIAKTANKIHKLGPNIEKYHGTTEEMNILEDRFDKVSATNPDLRQRLAQILIAGNSLSQRLNRYSCGKIHRDFYPDQLIIDKSKLYILDFDLYCNGNLSLDIGNFIGHMIEQSLREKQDSKYLSIVEEKMIDQYLSETDDQNENDIQICTTLTLMRHIYISTLFDERRSFTQPILSLCEERLETLH